jgi:hypothetical protein
MKMIVLLTLFITVGCILAAGCIGQTNKETVPEKCVCPACPTLTTTNTTVPEINVTANITKLKGPLRIAINGYNAELPVTIDNQTVGTVTREKPLDLMVDEGNHSVKVCVGVICVQESIDITFAKRSLIDFGDRLRKEVEFPTPTARIIDYYRTGDGVTTVVEFINPSIKELYMAAEVSVGYSYVSSRSDQRMGDSARGKASAYVKPGERQTYVLEIDFADGYSYMFDPPALERITVN